MKAFSFLSSQPDQVETGLTVELPLEPTRVGFTSVPALWPVHCLHLTVIVLACAQQCRSALLLLDDLLAKPSSTPSYSSKSSAESRAQTLRTLADPKSTTVHLPSNFNDFYTLQIRSDRARVANPNLHHAKQTLTNSNSQRPTSLFLLEEESQASECVQRQVAAICR